MVSLLLRSLASVSEQSSRYWPVSFLLSSLPFVLSLQLSLQPRRAAEWYIPFWTLALTSLQKEEAHLVSDYVQMEAEISQPVRPIGQVANMPETSFLGSCFCGVMSTVYIVGLLYSEWVLIRFHATTAATSAPSSTQNPMCQSKVIICCQVRWSACFLGHSYVPQSVSFRSAISNHYKSSIKVKAEYSQCPPMPRRPKPQAPSRNGLDRLLRPRNPCWKSTTRWRERRRYLRRSMEGGWIGIIVVLLSMIQVIWVMLGTFARGGISIGANGRNYLTQDIIRRILQDYFGYDVNFVMNITDIDDKVCRLS